MTITADARGSASTAAGPPTSSHLPNETARPGVVSPYGMTPTASGDPHGGAAAAPRGSETSTAEPAGHTPSPHQLPPAPLQARIVAGVIDLVIGSLLVGGLTSAIWQVGGRPVLTSGLIAFGVVVGARWLAIATTGWSLGGRLLSIRMLGARNQTPSPLGSFLHADLILAVSISTLGLGGIALMRTAAADPEGRGWHDKLSGMVLLSARRAKRPNRPTPSATQPERRPVAEPAPTGRRAAAVSEVPRQSSSQNIGEAWDAARRVSLSSSPTEQSAASQEPAETPSSQAAGEQDESASHRQLFERTGRKAEKKARKAAQARKRGSRPSLTSRRADQGAAQGAQQSRELLLPGLLRVVDHDKKLGGELRKICQIVILHRALGGSKTCVPAKYLQIVTQLRRHTGLTRPSRAGQHGDRDIGLPPGTLGSSQRPFLELPILRTRAEWHHTVTGLDHLQRRAVIRQRQVTRRQHLLSASQGGEL